MNLFGKKKQAAPSLTGSIQKLRDAVELLDKREKHLEKQMEAALAEAKKKTKAKDKRGALFQLKRKKMFEKQINNIYGKKTNLEMQIMALDSAASNKEIMQAMQTGQHALKSNIKETDVDKVADVMDSINESMGLADELSEAMAQPLGPIMDDDELEAELEEMEAEMADLDLMTDPITSTAKTNITTETPAIGLPSAPQKPITEDEKESRELEELNALMNA